MAYGASARLVPAKGGGNIVDADVYKIGLLGKTERGLSAIQSEIYSMTDFYKKCGGFNTSYYGAYVAKSFFDTLRNGVYVEMKVLTHVADDAVQASGAIMDGATPAVKIFDIKAGRKGEIDKSAFGNKIGYKITQSENLTFKLTADSGATPASFTLNNVDNLEIGHYIKAYNGSDTEYAVITGKDSAAKTISFAALTNTYTASLSTVYRLDWNLSIAVKDDKGVYQLKEEWLEYPMAQSDSLGMAAAVNNSVSGSDYVILAVNGDNASDPDEQVPAAVSTWTALSSGSDGTTSTDSDWATTVESFADEDMMILLAPESTSTTHNQNMQTYVDDGYKCVYYAQSSNAADEDTLKNFGASLRKTVTFTYIPSDKWVMVDDPTTDGTIDIPKVGIDAADWYNTYSLYGEGKVSAGNTAINTDATLIDSNGIVHNDKDGQGQRLIENYSVNICRYRRGKGITNNSARTCSTDQGYMYQNQLMMTLLYRKSILAYLETIEQDKAGIQAQDRHRNKVWQYMYPKFTAGYLYNGQKSDGSKWEFEDACIIVNDFTNNTLESIANGIEVTFLQFVATPPIEKPQLDIASAAVTTVRG